jgi:deoxycytidine triphosphate deaminase
MTVLADKEIHGLLETQVPILTGFSVPSDWYSKESLVQPSSLDLHVGAIFVPPQDEPKPKDPVDKRLDYTLHPGQAIVVDTLEEVNLPSEIAAFGFPPTSISDRAILMTNPGHIDPGFKGKLTFTLINMGREAYMIAKGQTIATLLLVKLTNPPTKDFAQRRPGFKKDEPTTFELYRLGRDFLDLDQRARKAAQAIVRDESVKLNRLGFWLPVLTAVISAFVAFGAAWLQSKETVAELKQKVSALENQLKIESRLQTLETKIDSLSKPTNVNNSNSAPSRGKD